jgi:hypothetical protein
MLPGSSSNVEAVIANLPSRLSEKSQSLTGFVGAEIDGARVPGTRLVEVGGEPDHAHRPQAGRVICRPEDERGTRVPRLRRTFKDGSRSLDVALTEKFLAQG